jgi:single-stranded-DNA-specific exonuclease
MVAGMRFSGFFEDDPARPVLDVARSAGGRFWRHRLDFAGEARAAAIVDRCGLDATLARVLAGRGVDAEAAAAYLDPTLKALMPDPSRLAAMDAAAERIADAVVARRRIALFGDYDVDGAASVALMTRWLRAQGLDPLVHIPDRLIEGYGPNAEAIASLRAAGAELLITLDCGSTSLDILGDAAAAGLEIVVIDHHQCGVALPAVSALVNPNRQDDLSGQGHLAAAGVTFLTLVAVNRALRRRGAFKASAEPDLRPLLDLVALATVADVVPLVGLNRAFVVRGLEVARRRGNVGLAALAAVARLSGPVSAYHLGFILGPRINAGGRIGDAGLGARLLASDDPAEAEAIAARLDALNKERQAIEAAMLEEAEAEVFSRGEPGPVVVTASPDWHPGVVGLIASRLKERYRRPAIAIAFDRGRVGTGSGRSIAGVDLGAAVRAAVEAGLLVKGGGHAMAAGLTIERDRLDALSAFLAERLGDTVASEAARHDLVVDGVLTAAAARPELVQSIERAGPFGAGQPEPVFVLPGHRVAHVDDIAGKHLRVMLESGDGTRLKAMAFGAAGDDDVGRAIRAARGSALHVAGSFGLDHWQGDALVQLRIRDVSKPAPGA